jgi:Mg2+ and Co2+ transporter CorA
MALQSIKPEDKAWVASKATTSLRDLFNDLERQFDDLNESILTGKMSNKQTAKAISAIRSKMLYASLLYSQRKIKDPTGDWTDNDRIFGLLQDNLRYITAYEETNILRQQKSNINLLTWVNTIFMPLTLIVGFYGMNFASMGSPSRTSGPFAMKHGQLWVFFLFGAAILLTIVFLFATRHFGLPST